MLLGRFCRNEEKDLKVLTVKVSLGWFYPSLFLESIVNEISSLVSFSMCLLVVSRKANDFLCAVFIPC